MQKATLDKGNTLLRQIEGMEQLLKTLQGSNAIAFGPGGSGYTGYSLGSNISNLLGDNNKTVVFNLASSNVQDADTTRLFKCAKTLFIGEVEETLKRIRKEFDELSDPPMEEAPEALEAAVK